MFMIFESVVINKSIIDFKFDTNEANKVLKKRVKVKC